jgi:protein TonB
MSSVRWALIGGSLLVHGGLVVALGGIRAPAAIVATAIDVTETTKKKEEPPPPPAEVEPTPPPEAPKRAVKAAAAAPPPEAAPTPAAPSLAALPDLGLEMSGGGSGTGMAVPAAAPAAPARTSAPVQKTLERAPPKADDCTDPPAKPKLLNLPQPAYTEDARAAGVEGKVRVELTVDETGKVASVKVLSSLGHGLDEAAVAAAKGATFEAAIRCGRPSRATFTIAIRFSAS